MSLINNILSRTPGAPLYHYTSYGGFLGIVTNKCMWATSIHYQNDAEEFVHSMNVVRIEIEKIKASCSDANEVSFYRYWWVD